MRALTRPPALVFLLLACIALAATATATAASAATMTPTTWKAGYDSGLIVKIEGANCKGYDLSMIDRLQLKDQYSTSAAFYDYEPTLLEPPDKEVPGLYEGPVLVQSGATDGVHKIDVYCNETDLLVGEFDVTIVGGKSPQKPKKCKPGKVAKHGKCVPKGPVKLNP